MVSTGRGSCVAVDSKASGTSFSVVLLEACRTLGASQCSSHDPFRHLFRRSLGGSQEHDWHDHLSPVAVEFANRCCHVPYLRTIHDAVSPHRPRHDGIRFADAATHRHRSIFKLANEGNRADVEDRTPRKLQFVPRPPQNSPHEEYDAVYGVAGGAVISRQSTSPVTAPTASWRVVSE